jgi:hypothetical protein
MQSIEQLKMESKKAADTLAELLDRSNPPGVRSGSSKRYFKLWFEIS